IWGPALLRGRELVLCATYSLLRFLRAVFGAALAPFLHTNRIERPANHVIADTGEIAHAAAADQHHRVLLQVVPYSRNISINFDSVRKPDARHLAQRGVRLLGRRRLHLGAHATLLRRSFQCARLDLETLLDARLANQLINRRQNSAPFVTLFHPSIALVGPALAPGKLAMHVAHRSFSRVCVRQERGCSNKPPKGGRALGGNIIMYARRARVSISGRYRSPFQGRLLKLFGLA